MASCYVRRSPCRLPTVVSCYVRCQPFRLATVVSCYVNSKVTINMITLLSVIIPYFQFSLLRFSFLRLFCVTVADVGYPVYALWLYCSNNCTWLCNLSIVSVQDEGYSRNASCALRLISTFFSLVFVFVPCFARPVLPVALDYLFLQDCTFLVLYNPYFHSHFNPLVRTNFHVRQTLKLIE